MNCWVRIIKERLLTSISPKHRIRRLRCETLETRHLLAATLDAGAEGTEPPAADHDIVIAEIVAPAVKMVDNDRIHFEVLIENLGDGDLLLPHWQVHLSRDTTVDDQDTILAWYDESAWQLAEDQNAASLSRDFSLPHSTVAGSYYLIVSVNDDRSVVEVDYANNVRWIPIQILDQPPISVASLAGPAQASPGESVALTYQVTNPTDRPRTQPIELQGVLRDVDNRDIVWWQFDLNDVPPGTHEYSSSRLLPRELPAGDYSLWFSVPGDPKPAYNRISIRVDDSPIPQAAVKKFQVPRLHPRSDPIELRFEVEGKGQATLQHTVFFSLDPWLDSLDVPLHSFRTHYANGTEIASAEFFADAQDLHDGHLILESVHLEPANIAALYHVRPIRFFGDSTRADPPVVVRAISADPTEVTARVMNVSDRQRSGQVFFFGSNSPNALEKDHFLGSASFTDIAPQTFESVTLKFRDLPGDLPSTITLFATAADSDGIFPTEINSDTPRKTQALFPDLTLTEIDVPERLTADSSVNLLVENLTDVESERQTFRVVLSEDQEFSDDDPLIAILSDSDDLGAREKRSIAIELDDPILYEFDGFLIARVYSADRNVDNNTISVPVRTEGPKLTVLEGPSHIATGWSGIELTVANSGSRSAESLSFDLYFGDETTLPSDAALQRVNSTTQSTLEAGQTANVSLWVDSPQDSIGHEYLYIRPAESAEPFQSFRLDSSIAPVDLIVDDLTVIETVNGDYNVAWTTRNLGLAPVRSDQFSVYLSTRPERSGSIHAIGHPQRQWIELAPGASYRKSISISGDTLLRLGEYQDGYFVVESGDSRFDDDFDNNLLSHPITSGAFPDLEIIPLETPQTFSSTQGTLIPIRIRNLGAEPVSPIELTARVIVTPQRSDGGSYPRSIRNQLITLPETLAPGDSFQTDIPIEPYYLRDWWGAGDPTEATLAAMDMVSIEARFDDLRFSANSANNQFELVIPEIDKSAPDFRVEDFRLTVDDLDQGVVRVTYELSNIGDRAGRRGRADLLRLYRGQFDLLESRTVASESMELAPGERIAFSETFVVPTSALSELRATIVPDTFDQQPDADRTNERFSVNLDLIPGSLPDPRVELVSVGRDGAAIIRLTNRGRIPLEEPTVRFDYSLLPGNLESRSLASVTFDLASDPIRYNETRELPVTMNLPSGVLDEYGRMHVTASIGESASDPLEVLAKLPPRLPFALTSFLTPSAAFAGRTLVADYRVRSLGDAISKWTVQVEINGQLQVFPVEPQRPVDDGSEFAGSVQISVPTFNEVSDPESLTIRARVTVDETVSLDLPFFERTVQLIEPTDAGLTIESVSLPESVVPGQTIPIGWSVRSTTPREIEGATWQDWVYFSEDPVLDRGDRLAVGTSLDNSVFGADNRYDTQQQITIPDAGVFAPKFVIVRVDEKETRADSNRDDNLFVMPIEVREAALWISLTPESDTGISSTDNITRSGYPFFNVVVPDAGTLTVDFANGRDPLTLSFDRGRSIRLGVGGNGYEEGTHTVVSTFVPSDSNADTQTAQTTITVDQSPPVSSGWQATRSAPLVQLLVDFSEPIYRTAETDRALLDYLDDNLVTESPVTVELTGISSARLTTTPAYRPGAYGVTSGLIDIAGNAVGVSELTVQILDTGCVAHNPTNMADVNFDGVVSPKDALLIINFASRMQSFKGGSMEFPTFAYDVNCSGSVTPLDALLVLNVIGRQAASMRMAQSNIPSTTARTNILPPPPLRTEWESVSEPLEDTRGEHVELDKKEYTDSIDLFASEREKSPTSKRTTLDEQVTLLAAWKALEDASH